MRCLPITPRGEFVMEKGSRGSGDSAANASNEKLLINLDLASDGG
jgi:hypothetical protein